MTRVEGDKIGPRPVNFHVDALQRMGATFTEDDDGWHFAVDGRLKGAFRLNFRILLLVQRRPLSMQACLAEGKTEIKNAAIEPEIMDMIMLLQKMGAIIELGAGRHIKITGVEKRCTGVTHRHFARSRLEAASVRLHCTCNTRRRYFVKKLDRKIMITFLNAVRQLGGTLRGAG